MSEKKLKMKIKQPRSANLRTPEGQIQVSSLQSCPLLRKIVLRDF